VVKYLIVNVKISIRLFSAEKVGFGYQLNQLKSFYLRDYFLIGDIIAIQEQLKASVRARRNRIKLPKKSDQQNP